MSNKANPFAHLMGQFKKAEPKPPATPTTPEIEEKNIPDSVKMGLTNVSGSANTVGDIGKAMEAAAAMAAKLVTPQAQQLLGAAKDQPKLPDSDEGPTYALVTNDLAELASLDTESMEPQKEREQNLMVQAKQFGQRLVLDNENSVRGLCDTIDQMIEGNDALVGPALIQTRNYVQQLMITLKSRPEFDSVLIDKDVRNVMKFIRATRLETLEMRELKTEKKAVRAANKEKKKISSKGFEAAFHKMMGGG